MAVRIVALLIPLAITLPYLQTNTPLPAAPPLPVAHAQQASPPEWSREALCTVDAALPHVVPESPTLDAVRKPPTRQAARTPTRLASTAKAARTAKASMRPATRLAKRAPLQPACQPFVHCAPVVVGKVTPVSRTSM